MKTLISNPANAIDPQLRKHIETTYTPIPKDEQEKFIEALVSLIELGRDRKQSVHSFLEQVSRTVFRLFSFDEIAIGLYDRQENNFYYDVLFGYTGDLATQYLKIRYDYEDMVSQDRFPYIKTGKLSELAPVEGLPGSERTLLNRPYAGSLARGEMDQFHEGDYIDFWMYGGPQKNIVGWIEVSKPRSGKLPARKTVRSLEVIASICSFVIRQKWLQEDAARR